MDTNEWVQTLTDDQREALSRCATAEEAVSYLRANSLTIPDELLEGVTGGVHGLVNMYANPNGLDPERNMHESFDDDQEFLQNIRAIMGCTNNSLIP